MRNILFFFSNTLIGGAETNIIKISNELNSSGFNIYFASFENNGPLIINNNIESKYFEIGKFSNNPYKSISRYRNILDENKIDIVSSFGLRVDLFVRVFSNNKVKIVSNIRSSENWRNYIHVLLDRITAKKVDKWVSNSLSALNTFSIREKIDLIKSEVIYNFIEFDNSITSNPIQIKELKIGILANYKKSKGHFNLPDICLELDKYNFDYVIYCAGHDYTNGRFSKILIEKKLEKKVILLGHISDKKSFFESIDLFFLPSYIEGMSTSMLEAMAFGVPIVASNIDGMPEAIENSHNGFLRNPDDFIGFAEDISKICNPEIRISLISNSYKILLKKFNKEKNMELWKNLFLGL